MRFGKGVLVVGLVTLVAVALAACGGNDSTVTDTVTTTNTVTTPPTQTSSGASTTQGAGETADLPLCSQSLPPCRTAGGTVVQPSGGTSGETADLPRCGAGPPPCRTGRGTVVEP